MDNIEIISVHYKTPDLIYNQYKSVRNFYPNLPYRIIDGSDNNVKYFEDIEKNDNLFNEINSLRILNLSNKLKHYK